MYRKSAQYHLDAVAELDRAIRTMLQATASDPSINRNLAEMTMRQVKLADLEKVFLRDVIDPFFDMAESLGARCEQVQEIRRDVRSLFEQKQAAKKRIEGSGRKADIIRAELATLSDKFDIREQELIKGVSSVYGSAFIDTLLMCTLMLNKQMELRDNMSECCKNDAKILSSLKSHISSV